MEVLVMSGKRDPYRHCRPHPHKMRGVWHDHVEIFDLAGNPLADDPHSGSPRPAPYDNLVYIDFDGVVFARTNVTFRGRPLHTQTFSGKLVDGMLVFDRLGPEAPVHIGVSGDLASGSF